MPNYKDISNNVHFLESYDFAHLLPPGCVEITDAEVTALQKPTIDQAKAEKWEAIKAERERRKNLGFQCAGHWYHSDAESKTQHLGNKDTARDQIAAGGQPLDPLRDPITNQPIVWKTISGQFVPLTCALAIDIVAAGKSAEFATFAAAEAHRVAMEASADPSVYRFSSGWPAVYEG